MPQTQQNTLLGLYNQRLKTFMDLNLIIQYNLESDDALIYMKSEQMAKYRIDRMTQIIKDTMLNQKQRIIIRALSKCQQLQSQINKFISLTGSQILNPHQQKMLNSKELNSLANSKIKYLQGQREVPVSNKSINSSMTKINNSVSTKSNHINIYEKLLQDKITQIKQLQKRQNTLKQQITNLKKINQELISQNKISQSKSLNSKNQDSKNILADILKIRDQQIKDYKLQLKLKSDEQIQKQNEIKVLQKLISELQTKEKERQKSQKQTQMQQNERINKLINQNKRMIQQQQSQLTTKMTRLQEANAKLSQNKSNNNLKLIAELKNQVVKLQAQLMNIQSYFDLIKQHFTSRLKSQVQKMKRFHESSKQHIKGTLNLMKQKMQTTLIQAIRLLQIKYKTQKKDKVVIKRLNEIDNQLDYFIQNQLTT